MKRLYKKGKLRHEKHIAKTCNILLAHYDSGITLSVLFSYRSFSIAFIDNVSLSLYYSQVATKKISLVVLGYISMCNLILLINIEREKSLRIQE